MARSLIVALSVLAAGAVAWAAAEPAPKDADMKTAQLRLNLRSQRLARNAEGYNVWQAETAGQTLAANETALVLCDVWDKHWSRGANERLARLLPRMNEVVKTLRGQGVVIVHAPSDTMKFYEGTPGRQRVLEAPKVAPPADLPHADPPQPIDASDGGSDTADPGGSPWRSEHPAIDIDQTRDAVSDSGRDLFNLYRQRGIKNILIMGVHTNMCVLGRSFAIKQMVRWGFNVVLIRDLTDTMYNPARPPYVPHDEGTRLVVEYIEKFWCPTVLSDDLLKAAAK